MAKYEFEGITIGISVEAVKRRYTENDKEVFIEDLTSANQSIDKKKLTKVLNNIWSEAFPQKETKKQEGAE